MARQGYSQEWIEAQGAFLAIILDRTANYMSTICIWEPVACEVKQTFLRFALPITWDFAEANPLSVNDRFYNGAISNVGRVLDTSSSVYKNTESPTVLNQSAIQLSSQGFDVILTDPPYYDAIPYSDLMDFFYIWLRRTLYGLSADIDAAFQNPLSPKWDHQHDDGELIDDSSRFGGNKQKSKTNYENGMFRVFQACYR